MMKSRDAISEIGRQLAHARRRRAWTQKEVAQRIISPASHLSLIEKGKTNPTLRTLIELTEVLGLSIVLVPKAKLQSVEKLIGQPETPTPLPTEVSSVYDDVFIPDPDAHGHS